MNALIERLRAYAWAAGCIAACVAVIALVVWLLLVSAERNKLGRDLDASRKETAACERNLDQLDSAIGRQNAATREYMAEVARRLAEAQAEMDQARKAAQGARSKVGKIFAIPPGADLCQSLDKLMLESVQ